MSDLDDFFNDVDDAEQEAEKEEEQPKKKVRVIKMVCGNERNRGGEWSVGLGGEGEV